MAIMFNPFSLLLFITVFTGQISTSIVPPAHPLQKLAPESNTKVTFGKIMKFKSEISKCDAGHIHRETKAKFIINCESPNVQGALGNILDGMVPKCHSVHCVKVYHDDVVIADQVQCDPSVPLETLAVTKQELTGIIEKGKSEIPSKYGIWMVKDTECLSNTFGFSLHKPGQQPDGHSTSSSSDGSDTESTGSTSTRSSGESGHWSIGLAGQVDSDDETDSVDEERGRSGTPSETGSSLSRDPSPIRDPQSPQSQQSDDEGSSHSGKHGRSGTPSETGSSHSRDPSPTRDPSPERSQKSGDEGSSHSRGRSPIRDAGHSSNPPSRSASPTERAPSPTRRSSSPQGRSPSPTPHSS